MIRVPGGAFKKESDNHYPEEMPADYATISPFRIDAPSA